MPDVRPAAGQKNRPDEDKRAESREQTWKHPLLNTVYHKL